MIINRRLGLSLSGGGYRAAAFHLGTLKKLNQLDILKKIDVLSTISGGSITGAALCLNNENYEEFHEMMKKKLETKNVITFLFTSLIFLRTALFILIFIGSAIFLSFTSCSYYVFPVLIVFFLLFFKYQFAIFPVSKVIEKAYNKFFFNEKTLSQFSLTAPTIAIGSSNLHTGRPFTFSQKKMSDATYTFESEFQPPIYFKHENFPIARAVMASSCVPFAFSPVKIDKEFFVDPKRDFLRATPVLIDGGVYDNQGIQKLTQAKSSYECDIIITSDAGGNFVANKKYPNVIALLIRTVDLFMYRIKAFQIQKNIYNNVYENSKPIAYISLGWQLEKIIPGFINNLEKGQIIPEVIKAHNLDPIWVNEPKKFEHEITEKLKQNTDYNSIYDRNLTKEQWEIARNVGTNLTSLSKTKTNYLITHAENITELQIKLYCPMIL